MTGPRVRARVWNRIPGKVRKQIVDLALEQPELSPRDLVVRFTDSRRYFVSQASVYGILKAHDLITSPAFVVIEAAKEFHEKATRPNQLWQTGFTYSGVIGRGWFCLSTILDDCSRYVIAWRLCTTTMKASDVTSALEDALVASGCDQATVARRPRLLGDNGSSCISGELGARVPTHLTTNTFMYGRSMVGRSCPADPALSTPIRGSTAELMTRAVVPRIAAKWPSVVIPLEFGAERKRPFMLVAAGSPRYGEP